MMQQRQQYERMHIDGTNLIASMKVVNVRLLLNSSRIGGLDLGRYEYGAFVGTKI